MPFLIGEGFDWVSFTGTSRIRALLKRIGFHGLAVATADSTRVRDGDRWGSYYDNEPVVIVGKLDDPQGRWCSGHAGPEAAATGV